MARALRALSTSIAALAFVACGSSESAAPSGDAGPESPGDMLTFAVDAVGPYRVGYRSLPLTYEPEGAAEPRTITVHVWYPTFDEEGETPVYMFAFPDPGAFKDASLAPPARPDGYPVHVYSHGWSGFGGTSANLMRYFASHGWVAVAPDHTGNTLADHVDALPISHYFLRSRDVSASLDALAELPAGDPLAGKALLDEVVLSGHSFGTFTTWATVGATFDVAEVQAMCDAGTTFREPCGAADVQVFAGGLGDPRVVAGIPMAGGTGEDPGWFGMGGYDAAGKPMMLMSGSEDPVGAENVWARVDAIDLTWLDFEGGCHQLFALGGCEHFDEDAGWAAVATYALAFARRHVLGDVDARVAGILDGTEVVSDKVAFQRK
jgi:predicted dienelactone hydrolase